MCSQSLPFHVSVSYRSETETECLSKLVPLYGKIAYHWHCAGELTQELSTLTEASSVTLALGHALKVIKQFGPLHQNGLT